MLYTECYIHCYILNSHLLQVSQIVVSYYLCCAVFYCQQQNQWHVARKGII